VLIFDNDDLTTPFRSAAVMQDGRAVWFAKAVPAWLQGLLPTEF